MPYTNELADPCLNTLSNACRDLRDDRFRPNRLLELLRGPAGREGIKDRTRCIYLLTATPMQIHPIELWDLLKVLGMGGRWGAGPRDFLRYFQELRQPFDERDWDLILDMLGDQLATEPLDPDFVAVAQKRLGPVQWSLVRDLPTSRNRRPMLDQLDHDARAVLQELARSHTPIRTFLWRNTRTLLQRYRERGLLTETVPHRKPDNIWIPMRRPDEFELYERIEEYIGEFYQKYEAERKGLGFVMTVYRRRLTSSFYAIRKSLERRLDYLRGAVDPLGGLTDEDIEQEDLGLDVSEMLSVEQRERFMGELRYVEDFLHELGTLGGDSKVERLKDDLRVIFQRRDTVLVFTQYTDTMDHLREELRQVYGSQVACYSGRGGEVWDGGGWVPRSKEWLKEEFRRGETVKILLCTESASEGLNLQTCGVLINFDMPWNPMRVEQRIGRIDRIGQRYDTVWVHNYFYEETVEATVYRRLSDRIDWFEAVVGELQPILHRVGEAIERLAVLPAKQKQERLEHEIEAIRRELDERSEASLNLDEYFDAEPQPVGGPATPVTLDQIEEALVKSHAVGRFFRRHPDIEGAYALDWAGQRRTVTFKPHVFDRYPNTVEFLTYGHLVLDELLASAGEPQSAEGTTGLGRAVVREPAPLTVYGRSLRGSVRAVSNLAEVHAMLDEPGDGPAAAPPDALQDVAREADQRRRDQEAAVTLSRREAYRRALLHEARQVLTEATFVEIIRREAPGLLGDEGERSTPLFSSGATRAIARHGTPFRGLLAELEGEELTVKPTDPRFLGLQGKGTVALDRRWQSLKRTGIEILQQLTELERPFRDPQEQHPAAVNTIWYVVDSKERSIVQDG